MKTVAVVCEYNPFHLGHAYHFSEIRRTFGEDTAIVAIMSGNYVQRGEPALFGKDTRAKAALLSGASLVLELPFPYSASGAEFFASAAVSIANSLGVVDALSFGSESGDIDALSLCANRLSSSAFEAALLQRAREKKNELGTAAIIPTVYREMYGEATEDRFFESPNNILALAYLKALKKTGSRIVPHTVKRLGAFHQSGEEVEGFASASHLRKLLYEEKREAALAHMPKDARDCVQEALASGRAVLNNDAYGNMLLSHFRLHSEPAFPYAEAEGGLYRRIAKAATAATDLDTLISLATTKKYPSSRIRRAALFSLFGVSPALLRHPPVYTQALAMDSKGQALLRQIKKCGSIPVFTKPSSYKKADARVKAAAETAIAADSVYTLFTVARDKADYFLRTSPYCK